jgi:hypothetical protein
LEEDTPIRIRSIGVNNSITVISHITVSSRSIPVTTLIDSGCTTIGCIDKRFSQAHGIYRQQLMKPKALHLADGKFTGFLTHFVTIPIQIGPHKETIALLETDLGSQNPIILGFPWLQHHNPVIDWERRMVGFLSRRCQRQCLPAGIPTHGCYVSSIQIPPPP